MLQRQAIITVERQKPPQLDHHDADGLAGQKLKGPPRPPCGDINTPYKKRKVFIPLNVLIFYIL
jgi:hypothetical protein